MDDFNSSNNGNFTSNIDMDASTQTWHKPIDSLFCLVLDFVIDNLNLYVKDEENLSTLPSHIRNRILRRFTTSTHFWKKVNFKTVLSALVNDQTYYINLTSARVDNDMLLILSKCKNIKKLYLSRTKDINITTKALVNLLQNCHNLVFLLLAHSIEVNDTVLECIAENCPKIIGLDIGGSIYVTDKGIEKISKLRYLTWATLSSTQITDEGISSLVTGPSGINLRELRIENTRVTDAGLKLIADNCPNLEILSFYSSKRRDAPCCSTVFPQELKNLKQLTWTVNW